VEELFSCRNCIQNCGQSLLIGPGLGYCIKFDTVLASPEQTTCKYLHRKDLPRFVVDEGLREHASEFASFSGLSDLYTHKPIQRLLYSEKFVWEHRQFDPINQSLAQYHKSKPTWIFLQAMSGGMDGRRALTHASLVRRYMDNCESWQSSYRFVLAMIQELPNTPVFSSSDLLDPSPAMHQEAVWDIFFTRLSGVQEYGFHAGLEKLMWATDQLNGSLTNLNWLDLSKELSEKSMEWTKLIIGHAVDEGAFFPADRQEEMVGVPELP